jgi:hypothetical protein
MVIIPSKNEKDLRDIPDEIRKQMKLVLVDSMDQVLETALRRKPARLAVKPGEVVDADRKPDERPSAPDKVTRGFPPAEQPPAAAAPADR